MTVLLSVSFALHSQTSLGSFCAQHCTSYSDDLELVFNSENSLSLINRIGTLGALWSRNTCLNSSVTQIGCSISFKKKFPEGKGQMSSSLGGELPGLSKIPLIAWTDANRGSVLSFTLFVSFALICEGFAMQQGPLCIVLGSFHVSWYILIAPLWILLVTSFLCTAGPRLASFLYSVDELL